MGDFVESSSVMGQNSLNVSLVLLASVTKKGFVPMMAQSLLKNAKRQKRFVNRAFLIAGVDLLLVVVNQRSCCPSSICCLWLCCVGRYLVEILQLHVIYCLFLFHINYATHCTVCLDY